MHFTDPSHVTSCVADKCGDGSLLLQVFIFQGLSCFYIYINDAWLDLEDGFVHSRQEDWRSTSGLFPLVISPSSQAGILFSICLGKSEDDTGERHSDSILNIRYEISGNGTIGAHPSVGVESTGPEGARQNLILRSAIVIQWHMLPCLAVRFLPLPSRALRVGQLLTLKWKFF
ncbi:LOW QUALITY PROTEIN: hypothetical protein CFOL_v3_03417 [Cephalotus follicularis]|uniref:Uncharacterized protein n=1 Tax=Cephalotus follicularis TaxID=3775 RepID=A0A1Q3AVU9_CEPFO|nr:LOW QUALITY PROTEIN: hypothetical protein CFOL_v3_03417 [Cephalotus follicularis]